MLYIAAIIGIRTINKISAMKISLTGFDYRGTEREGVASIARDANTDRQVIN